MTLKQVLFSFNGRINRSTYWGYTLALAFLLIIALICVGFFFDAILDVGDSDLLVGIFVVPAVILVYYISLAIHAKRFHDTNRSGWNYLWSFIPIFGGFYILVVCGCLKGTDGENNYGPGSPDGSAGV